MRPPTSKLSCVIAAGVALCCTAGGLPRARAAPLDLAEAVRVALDGHPELRAAEAQVAKARAFVQQARAGFWPRARLEAQYAVTDRPSYAFAQILDQRVFPTTGFPDFNDVGTVDNLDLRATVEVPLFTGLERFRAAEAAEAGLGASEAGVEASRRALALQVARAWLGARTAAAFVEAAEAGVRGLDASLAVAREREAAGTLLPQSVLEIETRRAEAREELSRARSGLDLARENLRVLLGWDADAELELGDLGALPTPEPPAARARPELTASAGAAEAAEAQIGVAAAAWLPQVGLQGSLGYDVGFTGFRDATGSSLNFVAGLGVRWQVFDGFLTAGRVAAARAEAARARAQEERLRRQLRLAREAARIALRDAETRVEVSSGAVELATRSVTLARARFEEGAGLPTRLIDAETGLTAARMRRAEAEADLRLATLELRLALGLDPVPRSGDTP